MDTVFVTTFDASKHPWGINLINSLFSLTPQNSKILALVENSDVLQRERDIEPTDSRIEILEFNEAVPNHRNFAAQLTEVVKLRAKDGFRWDVLRFSYKVFAIHYAFSNSDANRIIWIDADVFLHRTITEQDLAKLLPEGCDIAYLGRDHLQQYDQYQSVLYPECGFMIFNQSSRTRAFLNKFVKIYTDNAFVELNEWHDSYIFHKLLNDADFVDLKRFDICSLGLVPTRDLSHVFVCSVLGGFMDHLKGGRKAVRQSPEMMDRINFYKMVRPNRVI